MSRLIDADALSRVVKLAWDTSDSEDFEKSVFIAIATAPTIEERKKGKWIKKDCDLLYCSECDLPSLHPWPYCERCGADMRDET
jgi:hypothetical protein